MSEEVDQETIEEAVDAFVEHDSSNDLDKWAEEAGKPAVIEGSAYKVELSRSGMSREDAKKLTLPEYTEFGDVVDTEGIRPERLSEYTTLIPFKYKSYRDGTEKTGFLPKYPRFLDIFGVSDVSAISMGDVLEAFAPELHQKLVEEDMDADRLALAAGEILSDRGLDFTRMLDEKDYAILERIGVKNFREYSTVGDIVRMDNMSMDVDPDAGCVYNADYESAISGVLGGDGGECEVVPLESIMGGLDPLAVKRVFGKEAGDIREGGGLDFDDGDAEADDEPGMFMPFEIKPGHGVDDLKS